MGAQFGGTKKVGAFSGTRTAGKKANILRLLAFFNSSVVEEKK